MRLRPCLLSHAVLALQLALGGCNSVTSPSEKPAYDKEVAWQVANLEIKSCRNEMLHLNSGFAVVCNSETELHYVGPAVVYIETFKQRDREDSNYLLCLTKLDRCLRVGFVIIN